MIKKYKTHLFLLNCKCCLQLPHMNLKNPCFWLLAIYWCKHLPKTDKGIEPKLTLLSLSSHCLYNSSFQVLYEIDFFLMHLQQSAYMPAFPAYFLQQQQISWWPLIFCFIHVIDVNLYRKYDMFRAIKISDPKGRHGARLCSDIFLKL